MCDITVNVNVCVCMHSVVETEKATVRTMSDLSCTVSAKPSVRIHTQALHLSFCIPEVKQRTQTYHLRDRLNLLNY